MSFPGRALQHTHHLIDATDQTLGRLAASIVPLLRGKHKPTFRPNADCGDTVVVVNAEKIKLTGRKMDGRGGKGGVGAGQKVYRWHTGYPGGLKQRTAAEMLERRPTELLRRAVMGMIRRNNLRHGYTERRLKIYAGEKHPHANVLGPDVVPLPPVPRSNRTKRGEKTEVKAEGDAVPRPLYQFGLQYGYSPTTYSDLKAAGKTAPSRRAQTGKHTGDRVDETYFEDGEIKFQYMSDDSDSFFVDTREEKLEDFLQEWNEEVETIFAKDLEQAPEDVDNDNEIGKST